MSVNRWLSEGWGKSSDFCICLFPWCKYPHHSQFQDLNIKITECYWKKKCTVSSLKSVWTSCIPYWKSTTVLYNVLIYIYIYCCIGQNGFIKPVSFHLINCEVVFVSLVLHTILGMQSGMFIEEEKKKAVSKITPALEDTLGRVYGQSMY